MRLIVRWIVIVSVFTTAIASAQTRLGLARRKTAPRTDSHHPILSRELLRQATLIAARRELSVGVSDEVLGEPIKGPNTFTLVPDVAFNGWGGSNPVVFSLTEADAQEPLFAQGLDGRVWQLRPQEAFVEAEAMSRTTLVDALKIAGLHGSPVHADPDGKLDPAAAALERMELYSQLAALRLIDAQVQSAGESPARLSALARGYANAWQLSFYLWGAEPKAFAARALLYGQRAVMKFPDSAEAVAARGYAEALVGLPQLALADFDAAAGGWGDAGAPAWVKLATALAQYDATALVKMADDDAALASTARFFAFLAVEHMPGKVAPIRFAQLALNAMPTSVRLTTAINDRSGPGLANWSSAAGFGAVTTSLTEADRLPGLPADAAKTIRAFANASRDVRARNAAMAALRAAGDTDTAEPSWHAIAYTFDDTTFVTIAQRVQHEAMDQGFEPTDTIDAMRPLVEQHRNVALLDAFKSYDNDFAAFKRKMTTVRITDTCWSITNHRTAWSGIKSSYDFMFGDAFVRNEDKTAFDVGCRALSIIQDKPLRPKAAGYIVEDLALIAPNAPLYMAALIKSDWPAAEPQVKQWLDATGNHPAVTLALAEHYDEAHDSVHAGPMYEVFLAVSPDTAVYRRLAEHYRDAGNQTQWLKTVDECLKHDSPGLENAGLAGDTADALVERGRVAEALPYAEVAADTGAQWGLICAADVHERLGQLKEAFDLQLQAARRYDSWEDAAAFCVRTGHGDRKAVAAAWKKDIQENTVNNREALVNRVAFALLTDDPLAAEKTAIESLDTYGDQWAGLVAWTIALDRKDADAAKAMLGRTAQPPKRFKTDVGEFQDGRPGLESFVTQLKAAADSGAMAFEPNVPDDRDEPNYAFFTGRYLESVGSTEAAIVAYRRAMASDVKKTARTLAAIRLRAMGQELHPAK